MPPLPKDPSLRARRNKTTTRAVLIDRKNPKVPALPTGTRWHAEVRAFWKDAWTSKMSSEFEPVDGHALIVAARLLQQMKDPDITPGQHKALSGEFRAVIREFGFTPMSRRSLQWEIDRGEAAAETTAQRRAGKKTPAKKPPAKPDPRVTRAGLRAV